LSQYRRKKFLDKDCLSYQSRVAKTCAEISTN
jgi:hypothetical protein